MCIARHATTKRCQRQVLRDLRENQFAQVHGCLLRVSSSQDRTRGGLQIETKKTHELSISDQPINAFQPFNARTAVTLYILKKQLVK